MKRAGFHVIEASTVAEALDKVEGQAVALVDYHLPDGLGTEVLQKIRQQHHKTRVAFITAAFDPKALLPSPPLHRCGFPEATSI